MNATILKPLLSTPLDTILNTGLPYLTFKCQNMNLNLGSTIKQKLINEQKVKYKHIS